MELDIDYSENKVSSILENCFDIFLEAEFKIVNDEIVKENLNDCKEKFPKIIPETTIFDNHTQYYENFLDSYNIYTFKRDPSKYELKNLFIFILSIFTSQIY